MSAATVASGPIPLHYAGNGNWELTARRRRHVSFCPALDFVEIPAHGRMRPVDDLARTEPARPVYARLEGGDASGGAVAAPALGSMRWIMDTGSGYDLIARSHLTPDDEDFVEPTKAVPLRTANG